MKQFEYEFVLYFFFFYSERSQQHNLQKLQCDPGGRTSCPWRLHEVPALVPHWQPWHRVHQRVRERLSNSLRLIWTIWTLLSAVPRKVVKFNHSLTHFLTHWPRTDTQNSLRIRLYFEWWSSPVYLVPFLWSCTGLESTLGEAMDWCRQAASHYLSQWWPKSITLHHLYVINRPQWVNFVANSEGLSRSLIGAGKGYVIMIILHRREFCCW